LGHDVFEFSGVGVLELLPFALVFLLLSLVLVEQKLDFFVVSLDNFGAFSLEVSLNVLEFIDVGLSHRVELVRHLVDQVLNVQAHFAHLLDVVTVLFLELLLELVN